MADRPGDPRLLSVIVPVYNERNTIAEVLRRMRAVELPLDREIVIVDDGSTDGTGTILATVEDSTVRVVRHPANEGKGAAIRTGLAHVRGDLVLVQDADLEYDPGDWPRLLEPILRGRAHVVYGTRFRGERVGMPLGRWLGDRVLTAATSVLFNTALSDMQTGYKLFERHVLDGIRLRANGFDFEPEITAKVLRGGCRIYEVPVSFAGRGRAEGQKITWRDEVRSLAALVRYRFARD